MSKELESLEPSVLLEFIDGLLKRYEGKTDYNIYITKDWLLEIKKSLNRLESIDNANPSEAWKIVYNNFDYLISDVGIENDDVNICLKTIKEQLPTIKQALIKAQEPKQYVDELKLVEKKLKALDLLMQELDCKDFAELRKYARCGYEKLNKKYLKWEDLEFNHTPKMIDVKMSGNKYKLVVGYNVVGNNLAILRDGKKEYYFLECDKQFFNDLHLEVLEC